MPWAIPLVQIGIRELILPAIGVVTAVILGWYLTTPKGLVTWAGIVKWAEAQIKKPVEWALEGIKSGLRDVANAWENFRTALKSYVADTYDYIWKMHDWIMDHINYYVMPKIEALEDWRWDVSSWLHKYIEGAINELIEWKNYLMTNVINPILSRLFTLEAWRTSVSAWLHSYIEPLIYDTISKLDALKELMVQSFEDVWNVIQDIWNAIQDIWKSIQNLGKTLSDFMSQFDEMAKELQSDSDFITNLDGDWLILAYLEIMRPVISNRMDDIINVINEGLNNVKKHAA